MELDEIAFNRSKTDDYFPMEEYREGQREAIEAILNGFESGKKYIIIEAPTGSGKSAIAYTIAKHFNNSYWLTIQKMLQDQIMRDFGLGAKYGDPTCEVIDLKGRNAYPCNYWDRKAKDGEAPDFRALEGTMCDEGHCKTLGKAIIEYCKIDPEDQHKGYYSHCPYWDRKEEALRSSVCVMNFSSFLFQTRVTRQFGSRDLMIIDESHNTESELMKFIEFSISDKHFGLDIQFPKLETAEEYMEYFIKLRLDEIMINKLKAAKIMADIKAEEEWKNRLLKYSMLIQSLEDDSTNWVSEYKQTRTRVQDNLVHSTVILKPLFVNRFAQNHIFSMTNRILMMSATILHPGTMCDGLGIDLSEVTSYRMKNRFPVENRRINYHPVGSLSYKNKRDTFPKLVEAVDKICGEHYDEKGIIHTHNFEICNLLNDECEMGVSSRFLFQKDWDGDKKAMLRHHEEAENTIILAPAMHEGLDLKDDLSRFQIICKVPYPSLGDPQIKARMEASRNFYDWLTAQKLVQAYGRSVRSEDDWAMTYILDKDFQMFRKRAKKILPSWFVEAIM